MKEFFLFMFVPMVSFGLGAWFSYLISGRLRRRLHEANDRVWDLEKDVARLDHELAVKTKQARDLDQSCSTLGEELACVARERDAVRKSDEALRAQVTSELGRVKQLEHDLEIAVRQCDDLRARAMGYDGLRERLALKEKEAQELATSLRAAENRLQTSEESSRRYLSLVEKLQAEVGELAALRRQVREAEAKKAALESEALAVARIGRPLTEEAPEGPESLRSALEAVRSRWQAEAAGKNGAKLHNGHDQAENEALVPAETCRHW